MPDRDVYDAVIVGGGHNSLVAAAYLARAGRSVLVLERLGGTGGAAVSSRPFAGVDARLSRYSYLVSLLPKKIVRDLDLDFRVRTRTISSYTPTERAGRPTGLLVGGGEARTRQAFARLTGGSQEYDNWRAFYAMTGEVARRVFPTLTEPLPSLDELRARVDDATAWRTLFEEPIGAADRGALRVDLVRGGRPHRRPHRHLRRRPRPGPAAEPLLPLPRHRRRHRRLERARRRHGRPHRRHRRLGARGGRTAAHRLRGDADRHRRAARRGHVPRRRPR